MPSFLPAFLPNNFYHIYNRGNNSEKFFYQYRNYIYVLKKYDYYLSLLVDTYAYCLIPNHFHILIKTKGDEKNNRKILTGLQDLEGLEISKRISKAFSNFFNGYTKAIDKQESRHGSLFEKNFERKIINNKKYLKNVLIYIHKNPQIHGFVDKFDDWIYSSHAAFLSDHSSKLKKKYVLNWFDNYHDFEKSHYDILALDSIEELIFE